ncbi:hypothetical protein ILUMI_18100 [Ignelater luminosus]|uniref:Uncharacterized protein n=1 Tax=Ignelater luminosus TaxID=2038154 RepID=A0A8K0G786_IGNLU|nr:hypothetical protein ILUMI_18100 [Ignelater luminosus]
MSESDKSLDGGYLTAQVHTFLDNLPTNEFHYSQSQNRNRKYLSPHLTIAMLHRDYQQNQNFSFSYPRKDICTTCAKLAADINSATFKKDDSDVKKLNFQKELHLKKAQKFFDALRLKKENSDETELVICFDFEKNLPLLVTNIKDEYYLKQLWLHNFGINNIVTNQATMLLFTENFATKDSLCAASIVKEIEIIYPIPGHSMMPIDRCFALIEKKQAEARKIFSEHTLFTPGKAIAEEIPVLKIRDFKNPAFLAYQNVDQTYSTPYKKFIKIKDKKLENKKCLVTHIEQQSDQEFHKISSGQSAEKPKGEDALESDAEEYE